MESSNVSFKRTLGSGLVSLITFILFVVTTPAAVTLNPEKVAAVLHRHAIENGPWKAGNVEIRVHSFQPVALPVTGFTLRILRPLGGITPGLHSYLMGVFVSGKEQARLWVKAEVRVFDEVVVSSQPLTFSEVVKPQDVRLERRDISSLYARPFYSIEEVVGQQAARTIPVNETLTQKTLQRPNLVRRGSSVVMLYETGSLRVETPGIAEENGKAGDFIQVKNSASGKLLRGTVLDGRTVRIN